MANNGPKFVSVNLNKSYGQQHNSSYNPHYPHYHGGGSSYGQAAVHGRGRPVGGGAGGMVVLSRNRSAAPKATPKLSVPPPLNLPSLRKEHEKYDMLGVGGSGAGVGTNGSRPGSSGVGWIKPVGVSAAITEKNSNAGVHGVGAADTSDFSGVNTGSYVPPLPRSSGVGVVASASRDFPISGEKVMVLRGEDFPSLQDAKPITSGPGQKSTDGLNQKQKQVENEELSLNNKESYHLGPVADAQKSVLPPTTTGEGQLVENHGGIVSSRNLKKGEYNTDPLPLVHLSLRSDWADDERDTGRGFMELDRNVSFPKSESYWDREFDFPRPSVPPYKTVQRQYERHSQRGSETGNSFPGGLGKIDPFVKDGDEINQNRREPNQWRTTPHSKNGGSSPETANYRVEIGGRKGDHGNINKVDKYIPPRYGDTSRDSSSMVNQESVFGRKDFDLARRPYQNNSVESFNRQGADHIRRDHHLSQQKNRFRGNSFQDNALSRASFGSGGKMVPKADAIKATSWDTSYSKTERSFAEEKPLFQDISSAVFDEKDFFSGGVVGVIKRKKDAAKIADFHDPVRESFEAELERVQKMQELERQKIIEEQERAIEQARREEEERLKKIQEEEERLRRLDEEARESALRAEQARLESIQRAEEKRIARETEKKRIQLEEQRRAEAAKQKLLELEAKIAKRQAGAIKDDISASNMVADEKPEVAVKEKYVSRKLDLDGWENSKRAVSNAMTLGVSTTQSRPVEISSRPHPDREHSSRAHERGKDITASWRRDVFENDGIFPSPLSELDTGGWHSPRHDTLGVTRASTRKELYGGAGYMSRKDGISESTSDDFGYQEHRWNSSGNMDSYGKHKSTHPEFYDDIADKYGDNGWDLGHSRGYSHPPYPDVYSSAEANDPYFSGRSRYSMRQPRVLPPPLVSNRRINSATTENSGVTFSDGDIHYTHQAAESTGQGAYYDPNKQNSESSENFRLQQDSMISEDQKLGNESGCDSQSSLFVSSPPASPPHLSPEELDESEDSRLVFSPPDDERNSLSRIESVINNHNNASGTAAAISDSHSAVDDEEWTLEHDNALQQQEEYDEDENGNREKDEVHDENMENQNFGLKPDERDLSHLMKNVVLGFDEGVEVEIPTDDSDNNLVPARELVGVPGSSFGIAEERGPAKGFSSEKQNELTADSHTPIGAVYSASTIGHKDHADSSGVAVFTAQQITSSSANNTAGIGQTNDSSSWTSIDIQGDLPAKSDFGLFSGPSVPSPVPAIHIGSIRMPIHLHPLVGQHTSFSQGNFLVASQSAVPSSQPIVGYAGLNQNAGHSMRYETGQDAATQKGPSISSSKHSERNVSRGRLENSVPSSQPSRPPEKKLFEEGGRRNSFSKSNLPSLRSRGPESRFPNAQTVTQSVTADKVFSGGRWQRHVPGSRRARFTYAVRNAHGTSSVNDYDTLADANRLQRRPRRIVKRVEYRIREKDERKTTPASASVNGAGLDDRPNSIEKSTGTFARSGSKRSSISSRNMKQRTESAQWSSGNTNSQNNYFGETEALKDSSTKSQIGSQSAEVLLRRIPSEGDVDAPLQNGIVRVYKQSGIEGPSDEDDFIEVRSKRQMLNDRREQREKEKKTKSAKPSRKQNGSRQKDSISRSQKKLSVQLSGSVARPVTVVSASEPSPPTVNPSLRPLHSNAVPLVSNDEQEHGHCLILDSKNKVMSLSQNQIDEAMQPIRHNSCVSDVGGLPNALLPVPSIGAEDKTVSSLLGGEKIQFGAVSSPAALPPSPRVISHGIGAPGSSRRDVKMMPTSNNSIFFDKEKHSSGSRAPRLQDCEAEAEAAASAVAAAAINNDDIVRNDTKAFGEAEISRIASGVIEDHPLSSQSRADELSVSLPADLSVETTPISLWPHLASPHYGPHTQFPFYEMNPPSEGPIFGLIHSEESSGAQSQSQKSNPSSSSGPLGNWQQHSGVDSFFGHHPSGYSSPFIGPPPGSIPGVQGTPLVVYNHFTPVGQYGQVGLSFMGAATYIPPGKQADWKNPSSSRAHNGGEADVRKASNVQQIVANMPPPPLPSIQHLAPVAAPLLPLAASPLPLFDMSPFQQHGSDLPVGARWGHIPSSSIQSVPISRSSQLQVEGGTMMPPPQVNHGQQQQQQHPIDQTLTPPRSSTESRAPTASDKGPIFAEPGLLNSGKATAVAATSSTLLRNEDDKQKAAGGSPMESQYSKRNNIHANNFERGRNNNNNNNNSNQGNEWTPPRRVNRVGYRGENYQSSGGDNKAFSPSSVKVRQIYVAKQTTGGSSTT